MKERKPFLLRLDPALYESLERWAQQELRSVNGQIEFLLRQAVRQHERPRDSNEGADLQTGPVEPLAHSGEDPGGSGPTDVDAE